jgi:heat shock protein HslJ
MKVDSDCTTSWHSVNLIHDNCCLFGGTSDERDVSIASAAQITRPPTMNPKWKRIVTVLFTTVVACSFMTNPLRGTEWKLVEWTLSSLSPNEYGITAKFADDQISGSNGSNTYAGPYTLGPSGAFTVGSLESTLIAGPEPAMRAERAYMTLLGEAKSYKMADGKLTLYDKGGNESLMFEAKIRE